LQKTKLFTSELSSKATIIANCGAVAGGIIAGYASQYTGRRLAIIIMLCWTGAFIPLWILPNSFGGKFRSVISCIDQSLMTILLIALAGGAFAVQFGVQGAWGVVPICLSESAPPAFRASFAGIAYQLGKLLAGDFYPESILMKQLD
jgi:SHS family lactate transporter-like MFS transporter